MLSRVALRTAAARPSGPAQGVFGGIHTQRPHVDMQANKNDDCVVSPAWLKERLGKPGIKVLDASWYMPHQGRNAVGEFRQKRIPGARFFDVDGIADPSIDLPHMLPSNAAFSVAMDALGITQDDTLVCYDGMGLFSAPRAWWTFKVFGHPSVFVLEGGLPGWTTAGGELDTAPPSEEQLMEPTRRAREAMQSGRAQLGSYPARLDTAKVRSLAQMLGNVGAGPGAREQVVDARSLGRFVGTEPEPRPGLKGGHIPGALNVPFPSVLAAGGHLKPAAELQQVFQAAKVDLSRPVVGSCGSGLTAAIVALAAYRLTGGDQLFAIYDGSWSEWGARDDVPISTEAP